MLESWAPHSLLIRCRPPCRSRRESKQPDSAIATVPGSKSGLELSQQAAAATFKKREPSLEPPSGSGDVEAQAAFRSPMHSIDISVESPRAGAQQAQLYAYP